MHLYVKKPLLSCAWNPVRLKQCAQFVQQYVINVPKNAKDSEMITAKNVLMFAALVLMTAEEWANNKHYKNSLKIMRKITPGIPQIPAINAVTMFMPI